MIGDSVTLVKTTTNSPTGRSLMSTGCSEFPAHSATYADYISLFYYAFCATVSSSLKNYLDTCFATPISQYDYVQRYARFVLEALNDIAPGKFLPYTVADLNNDNKAGRIYGSGRPNIQDGMLHVGKSHTMDKTIKLTDDSIIGILTLCSDIRRESGCRYFDAEKNNIVNMGQERCRKVQIGHTMIRLMWSDGYPIALFALKIREVCPDMRALDVLWLAYKFRNATVNFRSNYGDIFYEDNRYVSHEEVAGRIASTKNNDHVMNLFSAEQDQLTKLIGYTTSSFSNDKMTVSSLVGPLKSQVGGGLLTKVLGDINASIGKKMEELIVSCRNALTGGFSKCSFQFTAPLFVSVALKVSYEGVMIPNSKLERIAFYDEEGRVLSVLKRSKYIKLKEDEKGTIRK